MKRLLTISAAVAAAACTHVALAAISYSYENDKKTLVVTVDSGTNWLQDDEYQAALNANNVTNLVKRGAGTFGVNGTARNFTGDVRIEGGNIRLRGTNPLGASGKIYISAAKGLIFEGGTVGKDVVSENDGAWSDKRNIYVWSGQGVATLNGRLLYGNRNTIVRAYENSEIVFNGGVGENSTGDYPSYQPSGGASFTFSGSPYNCVKYLGIEPVVSSSYPVGADGFAGHFVFAVAGNKMSSLGYTSARMSVVEVKTTVDWAFDNASMSVALGNDSVFDLCGTEQRVGQFDVKVDTGNPSVVTNSLGTPATLHMGMMYGTGSATPNIRFGGNLSVVFENNIWETNVNYPMTAKGSLIIKGNGNGGANSAILNFMSDGSWANATNVVVEGVGKIKIANPNALGKRANVNLKSNSSLEIASGVTVQVKTLTVGGVVKPNGDYTFGSGTLRVFKPGLVISIY